MFLSYVMIKIVDSTPMNWKEQIEYCRSYQRQGSFNFEVHTRGIMKCPKKYVKENFVMWWHFLIFLKCPKIEEFHFRFIFCFKIDHVLIFWNAPFFPFSESDRKNGAFQKIRTFKSGAFQKISTWSISKTLSHDKILFHMLFGAFHDTSCIIFKISYELHGVSWNAPKSLWKRIVSCDSIFSISYLILKMGKIGHLKKLAHDHF